MNSMVQFLVKDKNNKNKECPFYYRGKAHGINKKIMNKFNRLKNLSRLLRIKDPVIHVINWLIQIMDLRLIIEHFVAKIVY